MEFNPVRLLGFAMLALAFCCAWRARLDLNAGETRWFGWARLAIPASRRDTPVRFWAAMTLNIAVLLLFTLVGAFALRAGLFRLGRP